MNDYENKGLDYNTEREGLAMPEYGRNILKMVEKLKEIPDRDKRSEQARAVVRVMELLNPQVHSLDNYKHKLWDQLYMISGYDLDVDSPFPCPVKEVFASAPVPLPLKTDRVKAAHYGRNIEKIIELLCNEPDGDKKTSLIRSLAIYMRQQYLIWNKDSVADETIFDDIEKLSNYRIKVPDGINLSKISGDAVFSRPGFGINVGQAGRPPMNRNRRNINNNNRRPRRK